MKSLMYEASSVVKAIEKAWIAAGKPKEFSVRVYEEAQHNFIGMTIKQAKIGIFFGDRILQQETSTKTVKKEKFVRSGANQGKYIEKEHESKRVLLKKEQEPKKINEDNREQLKSEHIIWTVHMIEYATQWLKDALRAMNNDTHFQVKAQNYYLRFKFDKPLLESIEKERALFRSFSFLMLQALKKETRRPLRGFKIVLLRNNDI